MNISVITPVYGVEKYIEKSLRSLFTQTLTQGVEFVLVNDCSPDKSMDIAREVIREFPQLNVKIVEHLENGGLAAARQTGVMAATGEYMIHIDSDDWCEPTMLEDMYKCALENDADVVVADIYIDYPSRTEYKKVNVGANGAECVKAILEGKMSGSTWNKLTRRKIFIDNNLKWVPGLDIAEDWLIYIKIFSYANKVVHQPKAYLHYLQNPSSLTNNKLSLKRLNNYIMADKLAFEFLTEISRIDEYRDSFKYGRISLLNILISNSRGEQQKEFAGMYTDVSPKNIEESTKLPRHYKIALSNARAGRFWLANAVYNIIDITKTIIR